MPYAQATGARLYYEETGDGHPIIFVHEFSAYYRHWETQVRWFSRQYRCITFSARGYLPSEVPQNPADYGYQHSVNDIAAVLDHLNIDQAHVVGLSMGVYATLMFGLKYGHRATSLVAAGVGSGSPPGHRAEFIKSSKAIADRWLKDGSQAVAQSSGVSPTRIQLLNKDPRGWSEFVRMLGEHSAEGSAMTMRHYQGGRPSLEDFTAQFRSMLVPTLLVVGDEDDSCLETNLFLKRTIPMSGLWTVPKTGHAVNLEEPGLFNQVVRDFFGQVERGRWRPRDPRAAVG